MKKAIIFLVALITALLLIFIFGLNKSPNFLYPVTFEKNKYQYFVHEEYLDETHNIYAFRNQKNAFYIYDIAEVNRVIVWRFNELQELPKIGSGTNSPDSCDHYTYLTMDFPEISIYKKQGRYEKGIHSLEFNKDSRTINKTISLNYISIELMLDRAFLLNENGNSEVIFQMNDPRLVQFHCIVDEDDFFFVLAYGLTDRPSDKNILNLTQFESTPE